jgi:S-formylglutathione hydrolase FrmB
MKIRILIPTAALLVSAQAEIQSVKVPSAAMKREIPATVTVPDGYQNSDKARPAVYLLHGAGDNERGWCERTPVQQMANDHDVIIVTPGTGTSWYFDSPVDKNFQFETFVSSELVKFVDSNYRTISKREARALAGNSMGGHGAMFLAIRHRDIFSAAAPMSGGLDIRSSDPAVGAFPERFDIKLRLGTIQAHPERWNELTVINQVDSLKDGELTISMDCGDKDFFLTVNRQVHDKLTAKGIKHEYAEHPGGHSWDYWKAALPRQMKILNRHFQKSRPSAAASQPTATTDEFEKIAKQSNAIVPGLEANPAPKLPETVLPWDATPAAGFKSTDKIDTQAELDAELARMRKKFAPFMADLAPPVAKRTALELEKFDWRMETEDDRKDAANALTGKGDWKQVTIPHYGGPIDDAASYYRTTLKLDGSLLESEALFVHFNAVDYIADVWFNGHHLGSHEGLFDAFEFNLKPFAKPGDNVLLIKARNESIQMGCSFFTGPNRKYGRKFAACGGPGWNEPGLAKGWHMCAPGFGVWQRAWIEARPAAFVEDIFVIPAPDENKAEVWVEVAQTTTDAKPVELSYSLYGQNFKLTLAENQSMPKDAIRGKTATGADLYKFTVPVPEAHLRWWSPDQPWLYQIQVKLKQNGRFIDARKRQFGMRTFIQSSDSTPKGRFYLNGKEIKLRGANMMGNIMQCVIRKDFDQLRDDILLAKIANMSFWRMTQQPCQEEAYDYFDRLGLLAQTDMPVFVGIWKEQRAEALRQIQAMTKLVRSHPCNAVITYINEPTFSFDSVRAKHMMPRPELTALFKEADGLVHNLNPAQVIKWVDGDYANLNEGFSDHHNYDTWYGNSLSGVYFGGWSSTRAGWMHGCGEFGAEGLDSIALMKKYYPKEWLETAPDGSWTPDKIPRCQSPSVGKKWLGNPRTMEDWVKITREHQYWATRLMTESLRRDPKMNSFGIHLLIDAWPAGWLKSIMDCDRQAKPAYFAYRDALTPLSANLQTEQAYAYSGDVVRLRAWVCNDLPTIPANVTLRYQAELGGKVIHSGRTAAKIEPGNPVFQGRIVLTPPDVKTNQPLTVRLGIFAADGKLLHDTAFDIDLHPAANKGTKLEKGGQARKLIGR